MLRITEIFESIQGEGYFVGTPSLFIRLADCNLACKWCDTDHREVFSMPASQVADVIDSSRMDHLVITGGEPTLQEEMVEVVSYAKDLGISVQIETNGTTDIYLPTGKVFVTVSPKSSDFIRRQGNELKVVWDTDVWSAADLETLLLTTDFSHYYLQPMWVNHRTNIDEVVAVLLNTNGWRLSLQTHKYIGVR